MKNRVLYEILCDNFIFLCGFKLIEIVCSYIYEVGIDEYYQNTFVFVFKRKGVQFKTYLRLNSNALAFKVKLFGFLFKTYLRFFERDVNGILVEKRNP